MTAHPDSHRPRAWRAAACPGCRILLRFDVDELAFDAPELRDVMCALCGTITPRDHLLAGGFDITV